MNHNNGKRIAAIKGTLAGEKGIKGKGGKNWQINRKIIIGIKYLKAKE